MHRRDPEIFALELIAEGNWRDLRRTRLLEAATRVFARVGYEAASVEDIAFEAGIGKPTVYRYFHGKEALFEAVFAEALDDLEARLDAALTVERPFARQLAALIGEIVPTFRTHFAAMRGFNDGETSKRRLFRQRRSRIEARLGAAIEAGQRAGAARPFDAAIAARFLIGMVWSGTNAGLDDDRAIAAAVTDFALNGFGAEASS
jgi:AcrR family transcriptional regulator